jgi:hypothetical protein
MPIPPDELIARAASGDVKSVLVDGIEFDENVKTASMRAVRDMILFASV